jgi:DoxX-like family
MPFKHAAKVGWALKILAFLVMAGSGGAKLSHAPALVENLAKFGFQADQATTLGVIEFTCAILFLLPWTSFVGAILVAAYMGGATVTHFRAGESPAPGILIAVLAWVGYGLTRWDVMSRALKSKVD